MPSNTFEFEPRYIVLKIKDIIAAEPTEEEVNAFNVVCDKVARLRPSQSRGFLECTVVEEDWPEYELTREAIKMRCIQEAANKKPTYEQARQAVDACINAEMDQAEKEGFDRYPYVVGALRIIVADLLAGNPTELDQYLTDLPSASSSRPQS